MLYWNPWYTEPSYKGSLLYVDSHVKDMTSVRLSYLYNGDPCIAKMIYLYWNGPRSLQIIFNVLGSVFIKKKVGTQRKRDTSNVHLSNDTLPHKPLPEMRAKPVRFPGHGGDLMNLSCYGSQLANPSAFIPHKYHHLFWIDDQFNKLMSKLYGNSQSIRIEVKFF